MMSVIDLPKDRRPVRKAVQRLRGFITLFDEQVILTSTQTSNRYQVDQSILAKAFASWLRVFQAHKPDRQEDRLAYVGFAAGLMLRELVTKKPARIQAAPGNADLSKPAYFWPEGYLYVAFCLNVRGLVVEQDFHGRQRRSQELDDIRVWWSFKENVREDPSAAIAFLDLFAGEEPNWEMPGLFSSGGARQITSRPNNSIKLY